MIVIFSADQHIKLGQKGVPDDWQINRFKIFGEELQRIAKEYDASKIIFGGDLFDRLPKMDELAIYWNLLDKLKDIGLPVDIIPGNHEALKKNTSFLSFLKSNASLTTKGLVNIIDECCTIDGVDYLPYNKLAEFKSNPKLFPFEHKLLVSHFRAEIPPHVKPEIDLDLFNSWSLVLAGDLHSHSNSQRNIVYPGSPMTTSFHRNEVTSGVLVIDTESLRYEFVEMNMPQLLRVTISDPTDAVPTDFHLTLYELEGDLKELATWKDDSGLIDRKIVAKESVSTLCLTPTMTIAEELAIYLKDVMKLDAETTSQVVKEFQNDYST